MHSPVSDVSNSQSVVGGRWDDSARRAREAASTGAAAMVADGEGGEGEESVRFLRVGKGAGGGREG